MALEAFEHDPSVALAIYAHPGDVDVSCGGTLARWAAAGSEVHLLVCARGEKGTRDTVESEEELLGARQAELSTAAAMLGVREVHQLDGRDGELENSLELREALVATMRAVRPEVLVCPDPTAVFFGEHYFNHRDHRVVGWASLDAAAPAAAMPRYFPSSGAPHAIELVLMSGSLEPSVFVRIDETVDQKAAAVGAHTSQLVGEAGELAAVVHERAAAVGRSAGVRYAEAFRRLLLGT